MMEGDVKNDSRNSRHHSNYKDQHDGDKPSGAALVLGRWLRDAKGVDEGIRQKEKRAHVGWMILHRPKNRLYASGVQGVHLIERCTCGSGSGRDCGVD
jgi:hypothetical protein